MGLFTAFCNRIVAYRPTGYFTLSGEFFAVTVDHDANRITMDRVIAFRARDNDEAEIEVEPIGVVAPIPLDEGQTLHVVKGSELAPNGKEWKLIYQTAIPSAEMVRDITDACGISTAKEDSSNEETRIS